MAGDPLKPMAIAAGYSETERWWDQLVESRDGRDLEVFDAIHEMMGAVRAQLRVASFADGAAARGVHAQEPPCAKSEGFERIAVVCGAYHTPALAEMPPAKHDDELLRGLPKVKTSAAWVPWSYERLSYASGYGAGIESPVWYELLWDKRAALGRSGSRACRAAALRKEDVPASSAHVIEACRLADALRRRARPTGAGLVEYNDAAIAVLGAGEAVNLNLINRQWHFDARLGRVPEDFRRRRCRRSISAAEAVAHAARCGEKTLDLDLREPLDRERSHMLRRLRILGVEWGKPAPRASMGRARSTSSWQVRWEPGFRSRSSKRAGTDTRCSRRPFRCSRRSPSARGGSRRSSRCWMTRCSRIWPMQSGRS